MAIDKQMLGTIKNWTATEWTELRKLFPAHFLGVDPNYCTIHQKYVNNKQNNLTVQFIEYH